MDFNHQLDHAMPLVIGFVLAFAFALLLFAFRSLVVPLLAIALNLLSAAAAYGVLVLVFQHSWAEGILDFTSTGSIANWLPLFLFARLFGLSMDYHVFILSRIREAYDDGLPTQQAIAYGVWATAGEITSAAVVMVAVFAIFATLSQVSIKQAGVGLAVSVPVDATIVRTVLLPAAIAILGDRNWYATLAGLASPQGGTPECGSRVVDGAGLMRHGGAERAGEGKRSQMATITRRYRSSWRWFTTFLALFYAVWLVAFVGSGYEHGYVIGWAVVTGATMALALADWFVPRTVITEAGIRRRLSGSHRELAWSEVGGFAAVDRLVSPVDVLLAGGGSVPLRGVPATDVAELSTCQGRAVT